MKKIKFIAPLIGVGTIAAVCAPLTACRLSTDKVTNISFEMVNWEKPVGSTLKESDIFVQATFESGKKVEVPYGGPRGYEVQGDFKIGHIFTRMDLGMHELAVSCAGFTRTAEILVVRNDPQPGEKIIVQFETNGGEAIEPQVVNYGDYPELPEEPVKENCTFAGWYMDKECKMPYRYREPLFNNTKLYAKWSLDEITTDQGVGFVLNSAKTGYEVYCSDSTKLPKCFSIPEEYNGLPVTGFAGSNRNNTNANVNIGFQNCAFIEEVELPKTITKIEKQSFSYCINLKKINIPESVTSIGEYAFYGCTSLKEIEFNEGLLTIGNGAFEECYSLTEVTLPDSLNFLEEWAFEDCIQLKTVHLGSGITSIAEGAFYGCTNLISFNLPISITYIGRNAFWNCASLSDMEIEDEYSTYVANNGIELDTKQKFINALVNGYYVEKESINVRGNKGDTKFSAKYLGKSVEGNETVLYCSIEARDDETYSSSLSIPSKVFYTDREQSSRTWFNVIKIEDYGFSERTDLQTIKIPSSVVSIGERAFADCPNLKDVQFSDNSSLAYIHEHAFSFVEDYDEDEATRLDHFNDDDHEYTCKIPNSVVYIGKNAFTYSWFEFVELPWSLKRMDWEYEFDHSNMPFSGCEDLEFISVNSFNETFASKKGMLCSKDNTLLYCPIGWQLSNTNELDIPDGVERIYEYAFDEVAMYGTMSNVQYIVLNNQLKEFTFAFTGFDNLTVVDASNNNYFKNYTLDGNTYWDTVLSNDGKTLVYTTGAQLKDEGGYLDLSNLTFETINTNAFHNFNFGAIRLPETVKAINEYAFYGIGGVDIPVNIPESVEFIGENAFSYGNNRKILMGYNPTFYIDSAYAANLTDNSTGLFGQIQWEMGPRTTITIYVKDTITLNSDSYILTSGFEKGEVVVQGYTTYTKSSS